MLGGVAYEQVLFREHLVVSPRRQDFSLGVEIVLMGHEMASCCGPQSGVLARL
jgi:hypothetical protein